MTNMGFNSQDDLINEITTNGKFYKADFTKTVNVVAVAGRMYDAGMYTGSPLIQTYGDIVKNGLFQGSLNNWTANGTGYAVGTNTCVKTSGTGTTLTADSIQRPLVNGRTYRVSYTITAFTSGTCTVSIGGTAGTARGSAATFVEYIVAGATQAVVFTAAAAANVFTFGNISVTEWGAGATSISGSALAPLKFSNSQGGIYHGGDVGPDSKHLLNLNMLTSTATGVPSQVYLVDVLAVYPFLDANSASAQTLTNNLNVLEGFTVGSADTLTHTFYELLNLTRIRVTTTGVLPTGLAAATDYFVIKLTDTTCKLASSYANAVTGTAISISVDGSGTHTINCLLPRYTNGEGVRAYIVSAGTSYSGGQLTGTVGAVAHNFSISYSNQSNNSGNSLPVTVSATVSAANGAITHAGVAANNYGPFLPLAQGDYGIRSVETFQLSAASGTANTFYHLVLCRPITQIPITTVSVASERDLVNQLPSMPRVYDDANLGLIVYTGAAFAAAGILIGSAEFGWG